MQIGPTNSHWKLEPKLEAHGDASPPRQLITPKSVQLQFMELDA